MAAPLDASVLPDAALAPATRDALFDASRESACAERERSHLSTGDTIGCPATLLTTHRVSERTLVWIISGS